MSLYHFCTDCEHIETQMVPGMNGSKVPTSSCPARFNPREGKWIPGEGTNTHECPRSELFIQLEKQNCERKLR
jgi:hypothetical protein